MTDFLQNVYVYLWAVLALLMLVTGIKQKSLLAGLMSVFFVFMTVWYALRTFGGYPMFDGVLGIVFRCVLIGLLLVLAGVYLFIKKRKK